MVLNDYFIRGKGRFAIAQLDAKLRSPFYFLENDQWVVQELESYYEDTVCKSHQRAYICCMHILIFFTINIKIRRTHPHQQS